MWNKGRRRMTVLDMTLLVATAAIGMGAFQLVRRTLFQDWILVMERGLPDVHNWSSWDIVVTCSDVTVSLVPLVAPWTLLLIILRMRSPRPSGRRIWRQPGMAACLAAILGWLWSGLALILILDVNQVASPTQVLPPWRWAQKWLADEVLMYSGLAVATAWVVQYFSGRWRKPADWIDRLGRIVGVLWIIIGLVWTVREYLVFL